MRSDPGVIAVVAGVGAQFRRTAFQVTDFQMQADRESADPHQHRHQHRARRPLGAGEAVETVP